MQSGSPSFATGANDVCYVSPKETHAIPLSFLTRYCVASPPTVYDLPNRDCKAKASNGEICCNPSSAGDGTCDYNAGGDCSAGLSDYKTNYITPLAATIKQYCGKVPMVLVIEPDSLPNLASNMADPHCGNSATVAAYSQGIPYAVQTLAAACPSATQYLDAAHGGWLGQLPSLNFPITLTLFLFLPLYGHPF